MLKTMHGGLLEVKGQTYQIFVLKDFAWKYVENYDCLEVDELTFWNTIFLKSFVENMLKTMLVAWLEVDERS